MLQHFRLVGFLVGSLLLAAQFHAQGSAQWKDPSSHRTRFVSVEKNVQLEVLDWGGPGRPMILLAGGGDTAHVFDGFAPKLAARWHVYGITRRGFGASGYSTMDTPADRLGDDVVAVIDRLKIVKPVLAGHSFGGAEMSSVADRHPDRIAGLVYLDSAYSYAFDNGKGADAREMQTLRPPQPPPPGPTDLASFAALQKYYERVDGFQLPEAELRQQWESDPAGRVLRPRNPPGGAAIGSVFMNPKKYASIPVPALVVFANPHSEGAWAERNPDASVKAAADASSTGLSALTSRQEKAVREAVPTAHVIVLPHANHFVFLSNEADVLREIGAFMAGLN
jgi:pimeloyl-ACP methyl ester carboxylesterase